MPSPDGKEALVYTGSINLYQDGHEYDVIFDNGKLQDIQAYPLDHKIKEDKLSKIQRLSKSERSVYGSATATEVDAFINGLRDE